MKYFSALLLTVASFASYAQSDRLLTKEEFITLAAQMSSNCKARYLSTTKKLTVEQIEWTCNCISIRTLKSMTVLELIIEQRTNGDALVDPSTKFRTTMSRHGDSCTREAIAKYNFK